MPVSLGDGADFEHAALSELLDDTWKQGPHPLSIDRAVNDDMCNMNALWAEFSRHALRDHAQTRLTCREMGKTRHSAKRSRGSCKEDRAATKRDKSACRFAAYQESAECVQPPEV